VVLFFLAIQQLENNVLAARISGHAVGLHPLGAMFALLAGFVLAGLLGGLFAVPLAGVL
jgi:putative heme transporter